MRKPIYVRCRDGALYRDPVLVFSEGFVCFPGLKPELVIWRSKTDPGLQVSVDRCLDRVFGPMCAKAPNLVEMGALNFNRRVVPGSKPWVYRDALTVPFSIFARIPRPLFHGGTERHAGRIRGPHELLSWPALRNDHEWIEIPDIPAE